ncbi:glutamate--tRNA ligase [Candidatus Uhrbacteria bacterium]|nr:glutamate--tRNA ligase [Candidatus Uhrbacteria bacterium]
MSVRTRPVPNEQKANSGIRVRFAPSPTGDPHIGSIWTALMNWLFARSQGGVFVLRIEDTDQARLVPGSSEKIIEMLKWYGLNYDEGPVYQSKRLSLYQKYADMLVGKKHAYYCFCSAERLAELRKTAEANKQPSKYDRHCLTLDTKEIEQRKGSGEKFVIRLKIPEGKTSFIDLIRGKVEFDNALIDDQVLLKSDGFPTYHLANVVDDYEMKISHVIRAEEWLSSTPKHIILYQAFGWKPPEFAHLPLILGADRSKLSKRHGATGALAFRDEGYLPEAMCNFLALLGWNSGTDKEIFSLEELVKAFSLEAINKSGAIFNREKLDWVNGMYLRKLSIAEFTERAKPFLPDAVGDSTFIENALATVQERVKRLSELPALTNFYFKQPEYDGALLVWKKATPEITKDRLTKLAAFYSSSQFSADDKALEEMTKAFIAKEQIETGETLWPMRVALSGEKASPGPFQIAVVLGKEKTIARLQTAIDKL